MRRGISIVVLVGVVAVFLVAVSWVGFSRGGNTDAGRVFAGELYAVTEGSFGVTVPASGELAAKEQINIHNLLESDAVIIGLVDEGSLVSKSDVLVTFNDETIKNSIRQSELSVTEAKNAFDTSKSNLLIAGKQRDSDLAAKQLAIDLADLALSAWKEGEDVARRQQLQLAVQTAKKDYARLHKKYESSLMLFEKKFLSKDELDRDEIALLNSEATLKKAELDVKVYENYTFKQQKQKKNSDLRQAIDELDRAKDRHVSLVSNLEATVAAKQNRLDSQISKLEKTNEQLKACVLKSPAQGMVIYATSMGNRRDEGEPLKIGKQMRRNELVMTIPDTTNMIARAKVNEALSGLVSFGQRATVICDAYPDEVFSGEVLSVGVLAEGGGWRDPNRRDYTVEIKIDNPDDVALKPSMRCSAEIYVEQVDKVLFVPIHAIHRSGAIVWVWTQDGSGYSQKEIMIGRFSEAYAEIVSGLGLGDVVLLREPLPSQVIGRLSLDSEQ
jgi:multidrug efflux pump subunit AcrA (membrane-fusion protein)